VFLTIPINGEPANELLRCDAFQDRHFKSLIQFHHAVAIERN